MGSSWGNLSKTRSLIAEFAYYDSISSGMSLEIEEGLFRNSFKYPSHTGLQHNTILETYGQHIKILKLSGINANTLHFSPQAKNKSFHTLIQHSLKHCVGLKELSIRNSVINGCNILENTLSYRRNLDSLELEHCKLEKNDFFKKLSKSFANIKYFQLRNNKLIESSGYIRCLVIKMPETDIEALNLSYSPSFAHNETDILLVKNSTQDNYNYYMYNFQSMNDNMFERVAKDVFQNYRNSSKCFTVKINCKSVKSLTVEHWGERIVLHV